MAMIKKRILPDGKTVRWDVIREVKGTEKRSRLKKTFDTKREADDYVTSVIGAKPTVSAPFKVLSDAFITYYATLVETKKREKSSLDQIKQHLNIHVGGDAKFLKLKCGDIGTEEVQGLLDCLISKVSSPLLVKIRVTLSGVFAHGARRGYTRFNPVTSTKIETSNRPEVGESVAPFDLPGKDALRILERTARYYDNTGEAIATIQTLMYGGLRMSEFRGFPRTNFKSGVGNSIVVNQRADRYNEIGPVKSKNSKREIVIGPDTAAAIVCWLEAAPESKFVFPNGEGNVQAYPNLWNRFWVPLMNKAGLVTDKPASAVVRDFSEGQKHYRQPLFGFHMLRHVYASLQIERGVRPDRLRELMGHSTLKLTMDTYGHLWPADETENELAASVENALKATR